ncbi:MAG: hypothetical protein R3E32_03170 [Chitinophagales bacterium]
MTLITTEISSIQVKLMYLHFKTIKINDSISRVKSLKFEDLKTPKAIASKGELTYDIIDVIILFENYHSLTDKLLKKNHLATLMPEELRLELKELRKVMSKWKHVRNKIGGHLDLDVIEEFCEKYNYKGVFISQNLEADFKGILLLMMLESAINSTNDKSNLFNEELTLTKPLDLNRFIAKFMTDWRLCLNIFKPVQEFLYSLGKSEKLSLITKEDIGIINF